MNTIKTIFAILAVCTMLPCSYSQICNAGNESPTFPNISLTGANFVLGTYTTVATSGVLTGLSMTGNAGSGSLVQMGLYADNAGVPGSLIVTSGTASVANGTVTLPLSPMSISSGTYWIMAIYSITGSNTFYTDTSPKTVYYQSLPFGNAWPNNASGFLSYVGQDFNYWMNISCALPSPGNYASTTVGAGSNSTVIPDASPTVAISTVAYADGNFSGILQVDPTSGILSIVNAKPAGTYTVTVKATNITGNTYTTFMLTVNDPVCSIGTFAAATTVAGGSLSYSAAIGDFNSDGIQDLALANYGGFELSIRLGDGAGGFTNGANAGAGTSPLSVVVGDFNGDGRQDLAAANNASNNISVRYGEGTGLFNGSTNLPIGNFPSSIATGDFNEDGILDLAASNYSNNNVSIRIGDGTGGFTSNANVGVTNQPYSVVVGDFNNDDNLDIATASYGNGSVTMRFGDGAGNFSGNTEISVGTMPYSLSTGDFNEDGNLDFAAANSGNNNVAIRLGNGNGTFTAATSVSVGGAPFAVVVCDVNGDSFDDIATANNSVNSVSVCLGHGNGSFGPASYYAVGSGPVAIHTGDFNGDGRLDLVTVNYGSGNLSVLLNNPTLPTPPNTPTLNASSIVNCGPTNTTISIDSGSLNDANYWKWYSGSCGGNPEGTGNSIVVTPGVTTTYYVRGEGKCFPSENCGSIAITVNTPPIWYLDADGDLYSDGTTTQACTAPLNYFADGSLAGLSGDCDDANPAVHPGAVEICGDGLDNDCNGGDLSCGAASAIACDGIDDFVESPDNANLDFGSGDFTIEYWVNKRSASSGGYDNMAGVCKWNYGGSSPGQNEWSLALGTNANDNYPGFNLESGTTTYGVSSTIPLTIGVWQHLAVTRNGNTLSIYLDGVLRGTSTLPANTSINNVGRKLRIATIEANVYQTDAVFDDVRIWNVARTAQEIADNRNAEIANMPCELIVYYKFDAGTINANNAGIISVTDLAGGDNNGTLYNFALTGTASNWAEGSAITSNTSMLSPNITWYQDSDNDGYSGSTQITCTMPMGIGWSSTPAVNGGGDCSDNNALINPGAMELCGNATDDDCDGLIDETCIATPISNDEFSTAIIANATGSAYPTGNCFGGTLVGSTPSMEGTSSNVLPSGGHDAWYSFVALSTASRIVCTTTAMNVVLELHSIPGTEVDFEDAVSTLNQGEIMVSTGLTPGATYYVAVRSYDGTLGTFGLCIQMLTFSGCADGSGTYDLCTNFKPTYSGANSYTFNFTPTGLTPGGPTSATAASQIALSTAALGLRHGGTYDVTINGNFILTDAAGNNENTTIVGTSVCSITIAPHADLRTKITQRCPATVFKGTTLQAKPFICGAVNHTITFREVGNCLGTDIGGLSFNSITSGASSTKSLAAVGGVQAGKWYEVTWTPNFAYGAGTPGTTDIIYVASSSSQEAITEDATINTTEVEFSLYPNPNNGELVNINITNITSNNVFVRVMDSMGRVVLNERYTVDGSLNTVLSFNTTLSNGIYMVETTVDGKVYTERMVVAK